MEEATVRFHLQALVVWSDTRTDGSAHQMAVTCLAYVPPGSNRYVDVTSARIAFLLRPLRRSTKQFMPLTAMQKMRKYFSTVIYLLLLFKLEGRGFENQ
jgi:hypothetical protein